MPAATVNPTIAPGLAALAFVRGLTTQLFEKIPAAKMSQRIAGVGNHALWIRGHLATTDAQVLETFAGQTRGVPKAWDELFGYGSTLKDDFSAYPGAAEVGKAFDSTRAALVKWFESLDDEQLQTALPKEWSGFAPNYVTLASSLAAHEGMHFGQLTILRRELKLPQLM